MGLDGVDGFFVYVNSIFIYFEIFFKDLSIVFAGLEKVVRMRAGKGTEVRRIC